MTRYTLPSHSFKNIKLPNDRRKLEALVKKVNGTIPIWEGGIMIPAAFIVLACAILGTAFQEFQNSKLISAIILVLIAAGLLLIFARTIIRRKTPFFVLTAEGLETSVFKSVIPWRGITNFQINSSKTNAYNIAVGMEFEIDDRFLPEENAQCRGGSYYDEKKKRLMISGFNFRFDIHRDKLIELLNMYRTAALAQHKLEMKDY